MIQASKTVATDATSRDFLTVEDKTAATVGCLRAVERGDVSRVKVWCERLPELLGLISPVDESGLPLDPLPLKDRALELSKLWLNQQARDIDRASAPPLITSQRTKRVQQKLAALLPGSTNSHLTLIDEQGKVIVDDKSKADLLSSYWGEVFAEKRVDVSDVLKWMKGVPLLPQDPEAWRPRLKHVQDAIEFSN